MSESSVSPVETAFDALVASFKDAAFQSGTSATELSRIIEYMKAVAPLAENFKAGLPVSGKVTGKRGRKPKNAGGETESEELTSTQVESPLDMSGATSARGGRRSAA